MAGEVDDCLDLEATHHVHCGQTEDHREAAKHSLTSESQSLRSLKPEAELAKYDCRKERVTSKGS